MRPLLIDGVGVTSLKIHRARLWYLAELPSCLQNGTISTLKMDKIKGHYDLPVREIRC